MAQKKSYSRYFIILQEDEKGYSLSSDKVASGYAKLELKNDKCKISYYVQNLKKEMTPYYMMLVCNKKDAKKIIKISEMNIDDYGRADICYEYPVDNIAGSNISMDKVSGAAIVKLTEDNIISVMSGFASTEIPEWKKFDVFESESRSINEEEEIIEEKILVDEKSIFDKYEQRIELTKEVEEQNNIDGEKEQETIEDVRQEETLEPVLETQEEEIVEVVRQKEDMEQIEEIENLEQDKKYETVIENRQEEIERNCDNIFESINTEMHEFTDDKNETIDYSRDSTSKFFKSLVQGFEEVPDICEDIKRCKWYKVHVKTIQDMYDASNYNKYTVFYYPMISYYPYIKKHNHYLIGYKFNKSGEVKYLVYGIPGTKDRGDQPYGGKSGFVTWVPMDDKSDYGYWLMFYDFKTSTILIPEEK